MASPQQKLHARSESETSNNYSVLDYYDSENLDSEDQFQSPENGGGLSEAKLETQSLISNFHINDLSGTILASVDGLPDDSNLTAHQDVLPARQDVLSARQDFLLAGALASGDVLGDLSAQFPKEPTENGSARGPIQQQISTLGPKPAPSFWIPPQIPMMTDFEISKILRSDHDMYGFKKESSYFDSTKSSYNAWFKEYNPQYKTQRKKWNILMKSSGLPEIHGDEVPTRFPPKSDKVKRLVRKGIPPEWRGNAWFFYAGGHEKLNKNVGIYETILIDTAGVSNKDTEVIERDLHRTFPDNILFKVAKDGPENEQEEPQIITALRRLLIAFAHFRPQIGYCQSLNFLAGLLLLFMTEERAFWMLVILTERIIPKVHSANLEGVHTDQGVLMMCIREYMPKLWAVVGRSFDGQILSEDKILTRLPPLTLVTSAWFMSVFVGCLPIESLLRVWDVLWYEGSKTIFRISLTICRLCLDHPDFVAGRDGSGDGLEAEQIELFQFIQSFPRTITNPNLLIDCCFKKIGGYGFGFVSQDEINKCREFVSQQRSKLRSKRTPIPGAGLNEQEKRDSATSEASLGEVHDVYGFHKPIMSSVAWNMNISSIMKKKLSKTDSIKRTARKN